MQRRSLRIMNSIKINRNRKKKIYSNKLIPASTRGRGIKARSIIDVRTSSSSSSSSSASALFNERDSRPVILFDGVCNLCHGGVNFVLDTDNTPNGVVRFAALQSKLGRELLERAGRSRDDMSTIVLVEKPSSSSEMKFYFKSDAVLRIGTYLGKFYGIPLAPFAQLGTLFPNFIRDTVYDTVANNRYNLLGKTDECRFDASGRFDERFLSSE